MRSERSMNDSPELVSDDSQVHVALTAGETLRQARQAAGLHIAALAVMLKVPVKRLEALESSRFDLLPDAVFVRALAASVCRTLKIDAVPILAQLPASALPRLTYQGARINEEFRPTGDARVPSRWSEVSKPAVLAGLALVLGALVLIFLPAVKLGIVQLMSSLAQTPSATQSKADIAKAFDMAQGNKVVLPGESTEPGSTTSTGAASTSFVKVDDATRAQITANAKAHGLEQTPDSIAAKPNTPPSSAPETSSATFVANTNIVSNTNTKTSTTTISPSDVVVFTAMGESWVEATDAKGKVVLRRTLALGDVVGALGALPLKVVVGKANVTQVQVRGAGFDLSPVSKDNVARFEVK